MKIFKIKCITSLFFAIFIDIGFGQQQNDVIYNLQHGLVRLEINSQHGLGFESGGTERGVGAIVNKEKGLVATIHQIPRSSKISLCQMQFSTGEKVNCSLDYYHPWHDAALIKFNPNDLEKDTRESLVELNLSKANFINSGTDHLTLAYLDSDGSLRLQDRSIRSEYTLASFNARGRTSHLIRTVGIEVEAPYGSVLVNELGYIQAFHVYGNTDENESYEIVSSHFIDMISYASSGNLPLYGDTYVWLSSKSEAEIKQFYGPYESEIENELDRELYVQRLIPGSEVANVLKYDDIILEIKIGANKDSYWMDLNGDIKTFESYTDFAFMTEQDLYLKVLRLNNKGKLEQLELKVPVYHAEGSKEYNYMVFDNFVFNEVSKSIALRLSIEQKGVFISEGLLSGSLNAYFYSTGNNRRRVVVTHVNEIPVENLQEFTKVIMNQEPSNGVTLNVCDFYSASLENKCINVQLNQFLDPAQWYSYSSETKHWTRWVRDNAVNEWKED